MIVALEEGLFHFREDLERAGHTVVSLYGYSGPIDAIVYENESMLDFSLSSQNYTGTQAGILMICAKQLRSDGLLQMLREKTCGRNSILF